jgi:hypothetical protein
LIDDCVRNGADGVKFIERYEEQVDIPERNRSTCDFVLYIKGTDRPIWIEIDGLQGKRDVPYSDPSNEKIQNFRKNDYDYLVIHTLKELRIALGNICSAFVSLHKSKQDTSLLQVAAI